MKQRIILFVAVAVGLLAAFLTRQFLSAKERQVSSELERIRQQYAKVTVVSVRRTIPAGSVITKEDLGSLSVFENQLRHDAVNMNDWKELIGRKTLHRLEEKRPIFWTDIAGGALAKGGLASDIKPGCRAISINVAGAAAVSGMVRPNDRIDVIGTFSFPSHERSGELELVTLTIIQDVTVLATGAETAKSYAGASSPQRTASSYGMVTLEVTPREAEMLVFAEQIKGRLTLALRNPDDVSYEKNLPRVNFEKIEAEIEALNIKRQRDLLHKREL